MGDNNFIIAMLVVSALLLMGAIGLGVVEIRGYEAAAGPGAPTAVVETTSNEPPAAEEASTEGEEAESVSAEESSE